MTEVDDVNAVIPVGTDSDTAAAAAASGPSKAELKKQAKKAEKAAKKQAVAASSSSGSNPSPPEVDKKNGTTPTTAKPSNNESTVVQGADASTTTTTTTTKSNKKVLLYNGAVDDLATLKVIYSAQYYNVDVGVAKIADLPKGCDSATTSKKPMLLYGEDYILGGGGNAMGLAIALMGGSPFSFEVDEWCEVERNTLRMVGGTAPPPPSKFSSTLSAIASCLEGSSTGIHLVGDTDTMADISVIVALSKYYNNTADQGSYSTWPLSVQKYYKCHIASLEKAMAAVQDYLPSPPVNMDDPSLLTVLHGIFTVAVQAIAPTVELPSNIVKKTDRPKDGDYQVSVAMPAYASLKKSGMLPPGVNSPPQLAQAIMDQIGMTDHPVIQEWKLQGPGFIMCRITSSYLEKQLQQIITTKSLPKPNKMMGKEQITCLVDFSSPNIAKEMHVGHLRSTIIGEAVCRILEFVGYHVERVNHVGDWGTQFGMLIQYLREEYPDFTDSMPNITDLTGFYKAAKGRFDDSPDFKRTSQLNVVQLQSGDEECIKIWQVLCDVSRKEFQKVYDRLDVTVTEYGESFYNSKIPPVIEEFDTAGLLSIEEGGAKCVFVDGYQVPLMLQKSDGGYGYDSTDMAALKYRLHTVNAMRIIVITDFSQGDHFAMCNKAAHRIGWVNNGQQLQHIGFGTVQGEDGKRFKTRSGDTVRLVDLLDEAVTRMEDSLTARIAEGKANITTEDVHAVAEAMGYGAVKYFDLRRNPTSNYNFSYDAMLDTKGNTAVYLLYARVRFESIMAKAKDEYGVDIDDLVAKSGGNNLIVITHEAERNLALELQSFSDILETTLEDLFPYHICDFVYNVAIAASNFVTQCRVLGSPEMNSRLMLCYVTTMAMQQCFDLLGIRHVKRL